MQPHRWQPTRLPSPWDSPGKNAGLGCHFLLQCMKVESESEVTQSCPTLRDPMDCSPPGSSIRGIFQARVLEWGAIAFSHQGTGGTQLLGGLVGDLDSVPVLGRSPGEEHGNSLQYSCLEIPHGQRSLAGYSPWGCKESNMTEQLSTAQLTKV